MSEHATDEIDSKVLLKQRVADFGRAVDSLVERQPEWHGGVGRWSDSLYDRVRGSILGKGAPLGRRPPGSRLPGRLGHLDWLHTTDTTVARWSNLPGSTTARLIELRERSWRIEDAPLLEEWARTLAGFAEDAGRLLGTAPLHVYLRGHSCPACSSSHAYVGAERRRVPALLATDDEVVCQACPDGRWGVDNWGLLAAMLTGA